MLLDAAIMNECWVDNRRCPNSLLSKSGSSAIMSDQQKVSHWTWDYWTSSAFEKNLFCRLTWLTTESTSCYCNGVWNQGVNQELSSYHNLISQRYVITSIFIYTWQYSSSTQCYWRRIRDCWTSHHGISTWNQSLVLLVSYQRLLNVFW